MKIKLLVSAAAILALSGCASMSSLGDGRMDSWKEVRQAEETTKQEYLRAKQAEFKSRQSQQLQQNPTLKLTAYGKDGRVVSVAEMDLQPVIAELGLGDKGGTSYGVDLNKTPVPKGQMESVIDSVGGAAAQIANTPAVAIGATAYALSKAGADKGDVTINGETVTNNDSFNNPEVRATGSGNVVNYDKTDNCSSGDCGEKKPEEYYVDGQCFVAPGCSCKSYAAGLCKP